MQIYTIGHSNHDLQTFLNLLKQHEIQAIADVRSHPYCKYTPHFTKKNIQTELVNAKFKYVFLGEQLGARPTNPNCYRQGKVSFDELLKTEAFQTGIQRLLKGIKSYKVSLMCAEHDPISCHRSILICQHLSNLKVDIYHIKKDGSLESQSDLEQRLLVIHKLINNGLRQLDLFEQNFDANNHDSYSSSSKLIKKVYRLQGDRIAHVNKKNKQ